MLGIKDIFGIFEESKLKKGIETNFCCRGLEKTSEELLKKDILELINSDKKESYGKYNREIVKKYYSVEKMVEDCISVYNKTLNIK